MKNYQIKKIHLHFEVKNSESTSKSSNFATQFVSKENANFFWMKRSSTCDLSTAKPYKDLKIRVKSRSLIVES